jgi:hypothetical protein
MNRPCLSADDLQMKNPENDYAGQEGRAAEGRAGVQELELGPPTR